MKNKAEIKTIEKMLLDYVEGNLNSHDLEKVTEAIAHSPELRSLCDDIMRTLNFMKDRRIEQPSPHYWSNLLPRIHERISRKKALILYPPKYWWKILIPAAAVFMIFIVYKTVITPGSQVTFQEKVIEKIGGKDTSLTNQEEQQLQGVEKNLVNEGKIAPTGGRRSYPSHKFRGSLSLEAEVPAELTERAQTDSFQKDSKSEETISNFLGYDIAFTGDEVEDIYMESEQEFNDLSSSEKDEVLRKINQLDI